MQPKQMLCSYFLIKRLSQANMPDQTNTHPGNHFSTNSIRAVHRNTPRAPNTPTVVAAEYLYMIHLVTNKCHSKTSVQRLYEPVSSPCISPAVTFLCHHEGFVMPCVPPPQIKSTSKMVLMMTSPKSPKSDDLQSLEEGTQYLPSEEGTQYPSIQ